LGNCLYDIYGWVCIAGSSAVSGHQWFVMTWVICLWFAMTWDTPVVCHGLSLLSVICHGLGHRSVVFHDWVHLTCDLSGLWSPMISHFLGGPPVSDLSWLGSPVCDMSGLGSPGDCHDFGHLWFVNTWFFLWIVMTVFFSWLHAHVVSQGLGHQWLSWLDSTVVCHDLVHQRFDMTCHLWCVMTRVKMTATPSYSFDFIFAFSYLNFCI
jgi:hypothetical protein